MLSHTVSRDRALAELSSDSVRLLYTWMIPHADNLGRMDGDPDAVRTTAIPRLKVTSKQVAAWLQELADAGLILWYEHDGLRYVAFPSDSWWKHQRLNARMSRDSDFPAPACSARATHVQDTNGAHAEGEGEGEGEGKETLLVAGATATEPEGFADWYDSYPRKMDRKDAAKAFRQMVRNGTTVGLIVAGTQPWLEHWRTENTDPKHIKLPASFLRAERYLQPPTAKPVGRTAADWAREEETA